jgi:hypothetical protein
MKVVEVLWTLSFGIRTGLDLETSVEPADVQV